MHARFDLLYSSGVVLIKMQAALQRFNAAGSQDPESLPEAGGGRISGNRLVKSGGLSRVLISGVDWPLSGSFGV
jgi:hypothetical protein